MSALNSFDQRRSHVLQQLESGVTDKSPKGFIDAPLYELASFVNTLSDVYTTSSCSGRITIFEEGKYSKGGTWHVADHGEVTIPQIMRAVRTCLRNSEDRDRFAFEGDISVQEVLPNLRSEDTSRPALDIAEDQQAQEHAGEADLEREEVENEFINEDELEEAKCTRSMALVYFRFEPFILAVEARTLESASKFLSIAQLAGYRDSGITAAAKRFIINIRGALRLDVPIAANGLPLVDSNYILTLIELANEKMRSNMQKLARYTEMVKESYTLKANFYSYYEKDAQRKKSKLSLLSEVCPELEKLVVVVPRSLTKTVKDWLKEFEYLDRFGIISQLAPTDLTDTFESVGHTKGKDSVLIDAGGYMLLPILTASSNAFLEAISAYRGVEIKTNNADILREIAEPLAASKLGDSLGVSLNDEENVGTEVVVRRGKVKVQAKDQRSLDRESSQKKFSVGSDSLSQTNVFICPSSWFTARIAENLQRIHEKKHKSQSDMKTSDNISLTDSIAIEARNQGVILKSERQRLAFAIKQLIVKYSDSDAAPSEQVIDLALGSLPSKWEKLGNCALLPSDSFHHAVWSSIFNENARPVAASFAAEAVPGSAGAFLPTTTVTVAHAAAGQLASIAANLPPAFKALNLKPSFTPDLVYECVADALRVDCVAIQRRIAPDLIRSSQATVVWRRAILKCNEQEGSEDAKTVDPAYITPRGVPLSNLLEIYREPAAVSTPDDCWVIHKESGISYVLDVTKSMFSSGNTTEKARVSKLGKPNEIVVDAYAGIGYFTLPYLKSKVSHVYALELNPYSITALRCALASNLILESTSDNSVKKISAESRCTVIPGDNRRHAVRTALLGLADRVNLGLIPSSEDGLTLALTTLKADGGMMHIHMNVDSGHEQEWGETKLMAMLQSKLEVVIRELEQISSDNTVQDEFKRSLGTADFVTYGSSEKLFSQIDNIQDEIASRKRWSFSIEHIEVVKSFAPKIDHVVFDVMVK